MAKHGKLEYLITVPTGGWGFTLKEGGASVGSGSLTAGGTYYLSSNGSEGKTFLAAIKSAIEAVPGRAGTYTVTGGFGEDGSGKITISVTGVASFELVSFLENGAANNSLRLLMGFTSDLTPASTTFTSDQHVQHLWLPNRPWYNGLGIGDYGTEVTDGRVTIGPTGEVNALSSQRYEEMFLEWRGLSRAKTRIQGEVTTRESFQQYFRDCMLAEASGAKEAAGPQRFHQDADDDATYDTGRQTGEDIATHIPKMLQDRWIGAWNIGMKWISQ